MSNKAKAKNTGKRAYRKRAAKRSATPATTPDDTALLKLAATFDVLYREHDRLRRQWLAASDAAHHDPDHPGLPLEPGAKMDQDQAVRERRGVNILFDASSRMCERVGKVAKAIFAVPARTLPGAAAKLRIVALAYGTGNTGDSGGDADLEVHQNPRKPWLRSTIEDIECMAGAGDPVLALCAEWWRNNDESEAVTARGKGLSGEAVKRHEAELAEVLRRESELVRRIVATQPSTAAGALAMVAIAGELLRQEGFEKKPPEDIVEALVWTAARQAKRPSGGVA